MTGWREMKLGEFVTLQRGHDLTESERRIGTVPVMGSAGMNGTHDTAKAKGPGVVVGRSGGSFGQVHYCMKDFWPHNTALYVTNFHGNDPRFVFYLLKAIDFSGYNSGSAQPSLNRNFIYPIGIETPAPDAQRAIARVLGALDDKIELNRRMNRTLEELAAALFRSWFVDFDPVVAKAAGRTPAHLRPELAALFPAHWQDSPLGPIPHGWRVGGISDISTITGGGTPKTSVAEYWNGDIPWFSVVDTPAPGQVFVLETEKSITQRGLDESSANLLPEGTTIITARGTVGNLALVGKPMAMNQSCYAMIPKSGFSPAFVFFAMQNAVEDLQRMAHGSVFDTITRTTLDSLSFTISTPEVVSAFDKIVSPWLAQIKHNVCESRTLSALRDTLLPKLLSGELRVKAAIGKLEARA